MPTYTKIKIEATLIKMRFLSRQSADGLVRNDSFPIYMWTLRSFINARLLFITFYILIPFAI